MQGVGGTCSGHSCACRWWDCCKGTGSFLHGTSPLRECNLASVVRSHLVAECQARGRCFTPGIASSAWDVFPRSGSAAGVFP